MAQERFIFGGLPASIIGVGLSGLVRLIEVEIDQFMNWTPFVDKLTSNLASSCKTFEAPGFSKGPFISVL